MTVPQDRKGDKLSQVSDAQVRKVMEEMAKEGQVGLAALKAGMDRKTARKYARLGKLPSELSAVARNWKTRPDPFEDVWGEVEELLRDAPDLECKTVFDWLVEKYPGRFQEGQLRTLQRRVRVWRAAAGPPQEVMFQQAHRPGEAAQTDFTSTSELGVTVCGVLFAHLLCVFVLPYSNWQWATVCLSESLMALRRGVQAALFRLGRVPTWHQTDNSTAATHQIPGGGNWTGDAGGTPSDDSKTRKRPFNDEYESLMRHLGMKPRTIGVGASEQNGDVEAGHGALKRRLEQALLMRGSRDFDSREAWEAFVHAVVEKANRGRRDRLAEELAVMGILSVSRLAEYIEVDARVTQASTVSVKQHIYSVPSRLKKHHLKVRVYEDRIEAYYGGKVQLACERLRGRERHRIDYRHVIWSLVRKPGAFARYVYRESMFPTQVFRRAYEVLQTAQPGTQGDLEYLRMLHLAASTVESEVEAAVELLLASGETLTADAVKALVVCPIACERPTLETHDVDLRMYDALLEEVGT